MLYLVGDSLRTMDVEGIAPLIAGKDMFMQYISLSQSGSLLIQKS